MQLFTDRLILFFSGIFCKTNTRSTRVFHFTKFCKEIYYFSSISFLLTLFFFGRRLKFNVLLDDKDINISYLTHIHQNQTHTKQPSDTHKHTLTKRMIANYNNKKSFSVISLSFISMKQQQMYRVHSILSVSPCSDVNFKMCHP